MFGQRPGLKIFLWKFSRDIFPSTHHWIFLGSNSLFWARWNFGSQISTRSHIRLARSIWPKFSGLGWIPHRYKSRPIKFGIWTWHSGFLGIAPFLGPKVWSPVTMRPGVGRIWNLASSAACLISADCHRPNFQFPSENRGLGGGAILGPIVRSVLNGEI